jgi:hypothetical protein
MRKQNIFVLLGTIRLLFVIFIASGKPARESGCADTAVEPPV